VGETLRGYRGILTGVPVQASHAGDTPGATESPR